MFDVSGRRGEAIRHALADQLGLIVQEVKPFGLSGSAGRMSLVPWNFGGGPDDYQAASTS